MLSNGLKNSSKCSPKYCICIHEQDMITLNDLTDSYLKLANTFTQVFIKQLPKAQNFDRHHNPF